MDSYLKRELIHAMKMFAVGAALGVSIGQLVLSGNALWWIAIVATVLLSVHGIREGVAINR